MTGGLLQLACYGAQDIYLSGNPQISFFKQIYKRHTNFACVNVEQLFHGNSTFGQKVYIEIDRIGDLINQIFLHIKLPDLSEYSYTDENGNLVEFYWVNSIGNAIYKSIDIEIGGNVIDTEYGLFNEIYNDLTIPAGKRNAYYEMIGKSDLNINFNNFEILKIYHISSL